MTEPEVHDPPVERTACVLDELFLKAGIRTYVMAVLNVTPDSFSDGGLYFDPAAALNRAVTVVREGADILDIGAESTRPGSRPLQLEEECARLFPLFEQVSTSVTIPLSIDTYKADIAAMAIRAGASIVNDITALRGDPKLAGVVAETGCPVVLMHMLGTPATMQENPVYESVVDDLCAFFEERISYAESFGISRVMIDPGIGFGKTVEHNLEIIRNLNTFRRFGKPVVIGVSRKSFIGRVLGLPVQDRLEGTAAAVTVSILNGADVVRVHDVREMVRVARMTDALIGRKAETEV
jgi:dihydropteroate synthase